jgi:hypothetical protein
MAACLMVMGILGTCSLERAGNAHLQLLYQWALSGCNTMHHHLFRIFEFADGLPFVSVTFQCIAVTITMISRAFKSKSIDREVSQPSFGIHDSTASMRRPEI